ncbi:MAG: hypothetical protein QOF73_4563, partial [Thermomicrobiales bacterium]|nr:hypothetical protein [Thermomicrobiales bacterium]
CAFLGGADVNMLATDPIDLREQLVSYL